MMEVLANFRRWSAIVDLFEGKAMTHPNEKRYTDNEPTTTGPNVPRKAYCVVGLRDFGNMSPGDN